MIRKLLAKSCALEVARSSLRGVFIFQLSAFFIPAVYLCMTFNQFFPNPRKTLAEAVRDKHLLGYHDVRVGNNPESVLKGTPGKLVASHTCAMNMEAL